MSESSEQVLRYHAKSFSFAGAFLPRDVLAEAAVVYHFCRVIDDLVDDPTAPNDITLDEIELALSKGTSASGPHWLKEFLQICKRRQIPLLAAQELIEGVKSDRGSVQLLNRAELLRYSYRVAGCVGVLMCGVLRVRDPRAIPFAIDLGIAMQLTNIARDVRADLLDLGRVYLPATWLTAEGLAIRERTLVDSDRRLPVVTRKLLTLAEQYYQSGEQGLRFIPWRARLAILVAARIYRAIGLHLLWSGADPMKGRVFVSKFEKILWAIQAVVLFFKPSVIGLGSVPVHDASLHDVLWNLPSTNRG